MKQGDLVKLKEGQAWSQTDVERLGYNHVSEVPELLEVAFVYLAMVCCTVQAMFVPVGYKDKEFGIMQANFEVALPAGEPDVSKLLEESKETEQMLVGF